MWQTIALIVGIILPFWNIPLIVRIIKRRSSEDISLLWAFGVWVCILVMLPAALASHDVVWRTFSIINTIMFTGVVITSVVFHKHK